MNNNLRSIRRKRNIAQWGVASFSGVSAAMVSAIERWDYKPSSPVKRRIALALGVAVEAIWPEDGEATSQ